MKPLPRQPRAFTLVEILIVVVILGILAGVVIAGFKNVTEESKSSSTKSHLHAIRQQLEIYRVHHDNRYPTRAQLWDNLTSKTDLDGTLNPVGEYGPYLMNSPFNHFTTSYLVVAPGTGTAADGWEYNEATGGLSAVGFNETTGEFVTP